jgi:hypothetical protein
MLQETRPLRSNYLQEMAKTLRKFVGGPDFSRTVTGPAAPVQVRVNGCPGRTLKLLLVNDTPTHDCTKITTAMSQVRIPAGLMAGTIGQAALSSVLYPAFCVRRDYKHVAPSMQRGGERPLFSSSERQRSDKAGIRGSMANHRSKRRLDRRSPFEKRHRWAFDSVFGS